MAMAMQMVLSYQWLYLNKDLQMKYYYNPTTGEFTGHSRGSIWVDAGPYIEMPEGWKFSQYRVDLDTLEVVPDPKPVPPPIQR